MPGRIWKGYSNDLHFTGGALGGLGLVRRAATKLPKRTLIEMARKTTKGKIEIWLASIVIVPIQ